MSEPLSKLDRMWHYRPLLWGAFLFVACFFVWAGTTRIDQHVHGTGRVIPAGKTRSIQHLEGGILKDILIHEGDTVEEGQTLFRLSNTRADAERQEIEITLMADRLRLARLGAEIAGAETVTFPPALAARYPDIIGTEKELFTTRRAELTEKMDGLQKRMKQKVLKLDDLETAIKNLKKEQAVAREQLEIKRKLRSSGAISRSQYLEAESAVNDFNTRIAREEKEIPITKSELSEIVNLLEETRQNWRAKAVAESNDVNVEIEKLGERLKTFTDTLERTEIVSPVKGVVNKLNVNTIGGVIQAGQTLTEIIPLEETLVVEGRISTDDRGKVWPGLDVVAKITAYDYTIYGGIKGKLTYISPDSFVDNQNNEFYRVRVLLEKIRLGEENPVFSGMTVDLNIMAGKVSVLHALLRPLLNIQQKALREP